MRTLLELFRKSPFGPLSEHMQKIQECLELVKPMFEALFAEDYERLHGLAKQTYKLEHEADIIKNSIRDHMPKSIFLPVDRSDVITFLREQDAIADTAEDVAVLLTIRTLKVPEELREDIMELVDKVLEACHYAARVTDEIKELMETAFGHSEIERVLEMVNQLGVKEWEADKAQHKLVKKMFTIEEKLDPITIVFLMRIFAEVGNLANHAENTGDYLRLMISKK